MLASVPVDNYARYAEAAGQFRPKKVRVLFIQESPPYARDRHFYFLGVKEHDGLWVNLMRFLYQADFGEDTPLERDRKDEWLRRFQKDGYWTIDASHDSISKKEHEERAEIIRNLAAERIAEVRAIKPEQIVLVKKSVFEGLNEPMRAAGLPVVNDVAVPYPGRGQQFRFAKILRELVDAGKLKL
jgi:hypothetical protein